MANSCWPTTNRAAFKFQTTSPIIVTAMAALSLATIGCKSNTQYRTDADRAAHTLIQKAQPHAVNHKQPLTIETPANTLRRRLLTNQKLANSGPASFGTDLLAKPKYWPEPDYPRRAPSRGNPVPPWKAGTPVKISLIQALQIAARNSRTYQDRKEDVFLAALRLDDELDAFASTYRGTIEGLLSSDRETDTSGTQASAIAEWTKRLESGAALSARLIFDAARILSSDGSSAASLFFDGSVTIPLLRGSGKHIVYEPVTQAQRNLIYALWTFERFKRTIAVDIADEYLRVLQAQDAVINAQNNYDRRVDSAEQTEALAEAGRLSKVQVDQARQAKLTSRESLLGADQGYKGQLDNFKVSLGLPTDANLILDREELNRLGKSAREALEKADNNKDNPMKKVKAADLVAYLKTLPGGRYEIPEKTAIDLALTNRLDLKTAHERVVDAQRAVVIAADALKAGLDLVLSGSFGARRTIATADLGDNLRLKPRKGFYSLGATADLPWERTTERRIYRETYINLESTTRNVQELEDRIKLDIRSDLRTLLRARESYKTQAQALKLAQQRVERDQMFLDAGRPGISIRDVLEAEDALLSAQNALSAALVNYRVSELKIQRNMGVLLVNEKGLWTEYETQP